MTSFLLGSNFPRSIVRLDLDAPDLSLMGEQVGDQCKKTAAGAGGDGLTEPHGAHVAKSCAAPHPFVRETTRLCQYGLDASLAPPSGPPLSALHTTIRELP